MTNALGDKIKPLVIGKSETPRCLKNVKKQDLPVTYKHSKKSWMTAAIYEEWIEEINTHFKKLQRKILLFIDNCSVHKDINCSNVKLTFLPPNTTALI